MNPFNKSNNTPKNPTDHMSMNGTPMNPMNMQGIPGGKPMTMVGSSCGDRMQHSMEGGKKYSGSMVYNNSSPSAKVLGKINTPK